MADNLYNTIYNPDVLSCIANLSNDEVFTPPVIANKMLDLLPQELFSDPKTTFLDPACKSGVFLREIAKRLLKGLETQIPDLQERANHIFKKQLYGISITELTSHLSRRSVYCSKTANGTYSVVDFDTVDGNIRFKPIEHTWVNGKCKFCGAPKQKYNRGDELESHAYEFIHAAKPEEIFNMKFDVIISNPPYQLNDGGAQASASPIYQIFVRQAKILNPRYIVMIIPARWYAGGKGLEEFRKEMIEDKRIRVLHDFLSAAECFGNGVEIKSGVCYFLWNRDDAGLCEIVTHLPDGAQSAALRWMKYKATDVFIRRNEAISIVEKVNFARDNFASLVSSRKPFGLSTTDVGHKNKALNDIVIYQHGGTAYFNKHKILRHKEWVGQYKVYITKAYGASDEWPHQILNKPILGQKGDCCSETYLLIGPFKTEREAKNVMSYIHTKFFRFLVSLRKISQDATQSVYSFVPMQDFSKPWTDAELYKKYKLTKDEIAFIESMIKPME